MRGTNDAVKVNASLRRRLLTLLLFLAIGDVLAAQLAKILLPTDAHRDAEREYRTASDIFHHGLRPNAQAWSQWGSHGFQIATNSLGFKDAAIRDVPLRTSAKRILFVGDSFTEGVGFPYEKTFVGRVADALALQKVEVLNAGVASYSPSIYYAKTKHLLEDVGLEFDELVVFLDTSDIHDDSVFYQLTEDDRVVDAPGAPEGGMAAVNERLDADPRHALKAFIRNNSVLVRVADLAKDRLWPTSWQTARPEDSGFRAMLETPRSAWTRDDEQWQEFGMRGIDNAARAMDKLAALLAARSIPLTIVVYPWPSHILEPQGNERHVGFWREWCAATGARFVDLFPLFVGERPALEMLHEYYLPLDGHWNEAGHRYVAEGFLARAALLGTEAE